MRGGLSHLSVDYRVVPRPCAHEAILDGKDVEVYAYDPSDDGDEVVLMRVALERTDAAPAWWRLKDGGERAPTVAALVTYAVRDPAVAAALVSMAHEGAFGP